MARSARACAICGTRILVSKDPASQEAWDVEVGTFYLCSQNMTSYREALAKLRKEKA